MSKLMVVEVPSYSCEFKGIREIGELVYCEHCKEWEPHLNGQLGWCETFHFYLPPHFFCASGEEKRE